MLWGRTAPSLRERLCAAPTAAERFRLLDAALLEELSHATPDHRAISPAVTALAEAALPIAALAERARLSHRHFIELFSAQVGMRPKLFQRLKRFERALALARAAPVAAQRGAAGGSWGARIALAAGFCDQSHWIRECVALSGLTPAQYCSSWGQQLKEHHLAEPGAG